MTILNVPAAASLDRAACAVVALAAVLERDYTTTRNELIAAKVYRPRGGSKYFAMMAWLRKQGRLTCEINRSGPNGKPLTLAQFLRQADPTKIYLIITAGHAQALVRGKHVNTSARMLSRCKIIVEILDQVKITGNVVLNAFREIPFEQTIAMLASLTGKTEKQVRGLIDQARRKGHNIINHGGKFRLIEQE